jgi:hypothetical protein
MARKSRRQETEAAEKTWTQPSRIRLRRGTPAATFVDEAQYVHVRGDLIRIGVLALVLFSALILLWVLTTVL